MRNLALAVALSLPLQGCFFIFLPIGAIAEAISGSTGDHCVNVNTKVGDTFPSPTGGRLQVQSLSGASTRCNDPNRPVRAKLVQMPA